MTEKRRAAVLVPLLALFFGRVDVGRADSAPDPQVVPVQE